MLKRPGFQTSEWAVSLVTAILNIVNNSQGWVSWRDALLPTLAAVAYIVSRGLAKYEPRGNPPV
jgi:tryptophan-rich sensory protein